MGEDDYAGFSNDASCSAAEYLDKQGVDPSFYSTSFLEASELGDPSSLRQRLDRLSGDEKRELVRSVDQQGCTGLLLFAKRGDSEMVDILLDAGAIADDADNSGVTSLHYAAGRGSAVIVKALLSFAANVEAKDERSETPLMWARSAETMRLLVEAKADVNAKSINGQTSLMLASQRGDDDSIRVLAQFPAVDLEACDSEGCSAHAVAMAAGHLDAAKLLVSLGAKAVGKPCSRIIRCEEALLEAARRGDAAACADFLRDGVDVEAEVGGETALLLAAGAACSRAVENLLHNRADPNHADPFLGETPLIRATLSKSTNEMLWMLLEAKADPLQKDLSGRTAAEVAAAWGNADSTDILKAAEAGELPLGTMD